MLIDQETGWLTGIIRKARPKIDSNQRCVLLTTESLINN
jgi:hypothetical protein